SASVAIGDFNRDGHPDLAVANQSSNNVSILLGNGDGTFGTPTNYATGAASIYVTTADYDFDFKLDLAVANLNAHTVSVLRGNGPFQLAVHYAIGSLVRCVKFADFNRDGRLDLGVISLNAPSIVVLLGNGAGGFGAPITTPYTSSRGPNDFGVADLNGDLIPD